MSYVVLGPVACQGCRRNVYWGRTRLRDSVVGELAWRNAHNRRRHFCERGL